MTNDEKVKKKEDLLDRLDRILEWIRACDTKSSILLAIISLIMTIFSSEFFIIKYKLIIKYNLNDFDFSKFLFLLILSCFLLLFLSGIIYLVLELNPQLISKKNANKDINSLYFFESIEKKELAQFKQEILEVGIESDIEDISTQIYINSKICTRKYKYTKLGILNSMTGTFGIIAMFFIGWLILMTN